MNIRIETEQGEVVSETTLKDLFNDNPEMTASERFAISESLIASDGRYMADIGGGVMVIKRVGQINAHDRAAAVYGAKAERETDPVLKSILGAVANANQHLADRKSEEETALQDQADELARAVSHAILGTYRVELRDRQETPTQDDLMDEIKPAILKSLREERSLR